MNKTKKCRTQTQIKKKKNVLIKRDYIRSRGIDVSHYVFKRTNVNRTTTICAFELKKGSFSLKAAFRRRRRRSRV